MEGRGQSWTAQQLVQVVGSLPSKTTDCHLLCARQSPDCFHTPLFSYSFYKLLLQMGKWRYKKATDGTELAFEPRPPDSSPRPSPAWPEPVLREASFEDAGLSGGPPFTPGGLTLAFRGAEERESGRGTQ